MDKHELNLVRIANRTLTQSKDFTENKKWGKRRRKRKKSDMKWILQNRTLLLRSHRKSRPDFLNLLPNLGNINKGT